MNNDNEWVSPTEVMSLLWRRKWLLAVIGLACGIAAFIGSFMIAPRYEAKVVLLPDSMDESGGVAAYLTRASGLASVIGLAGSTGGSVEAVEFLKSADLRGRFISKHSVLPVLFSQRLASDGRTWKPDEKVPTDFEAVQKFGVSVLSVRQDARTGIVTVSIDWTDPVTAAQWANDYVGLADELLQQRAVRESNEALAYLVAERERSTFLSVQQAISAVMERQIAQIAMAQSRAYYAYRIIDPARAPDVTAFHWPRRILLSLGGVTLGMLLAVVAIFVFAARRH